jgi:4-amino-4-deoxy-L-arabinose transferase-like glycosyltransferase
MTDTMAARSPSREIVEAPTRTNVRVALVLLLAAAVRLWGLHTQSLSMDEVTELTIARRDLSAIPWVSDGFPPLYHLLLHIWLKLFPGDDASRWLALILGVLSVLAIWRLGHLLGGRVIGECTALCLALSPLHVWYSQEGRAYTLYFLVAVVALWLFFRAIETARQSDWMMYGLACAAGMYVHYYFFVLVLANAVILVAERPGRRHLGPAVAAHAAIALLSVPLVWVVRGDFQSHANLRNVYVPFNLLTVGYAFFTFVVGYSAGPSVQELHTMRPREAVIQALPWVLAAGPATVVLLVQGARAVGSRWVRRLAIIAVLPMIGVGLLAQLPGMGFRVRYVLCAAIPLLILVGAGISRARSSRLALIAALALGVVSAASLHNRRTSERYMNEDVRSLGAFLRSLDGKRAPVFVISGYMAAPVSLYLGGDWTVVAVPTVRERTGGPADVLKLIESSVPDGARFWLVYSRPFHGDPDSQVRELLLRAELIRPEREFPGIVLYEGRRP